MVANKKVNEMPCGISTAVKEEPCGISVAVKEEKAAPTKPNTEEKKLLSFNEWKNIDIRVGLIESVEDIPNKDKLYKLLVDFGTEKRTVVSGLKLYYTKEELIGKKSPFVYNLAPAKLAGIESRAMILAARNAEGKYKIFFADDSVPQGTAVE